MRRSWLANLRPYRSLTAQHCLEDRSRVDRQSQRANFQENMVRSPSMRNTLKITILALCLLGGCKDDRSVNGHAFFVPEAYKLNSDILWFPDRRGKDVSFLVDPNESQQNQFAVLIQTRLDACSRNGTRAYLSDVCGEDREINRYSLPISALSKVESTDHGLDSYYVLNRQGRLVYVARCIELPNQSMSFGGMCSSIVKYKDIFLKIEYREDMLTNLHDAIGRAGELLRSWER
jgi:hypothetical protein